MIHKQMGCARDHSAELDIYNKPYAEKINRIQLMKEQGNLAMKRLGQAKKTDPQDEDHESDETLMEKASYYYAQALLIFYYLIPENDA